MQGRRKNLLCATHLSYSDGDRGERRRALSRPRTHTAENRSKDSEIGRGEEGEYLFFMVVSAVRHSPAPSISLAFSTEWMKKTTMFYNLEEKKTSTVIGARMSYRKWRENKQHLI